jgi:hypothetical protein
VNAFPVDEVVVRVFKKKDKLYALTTSQEQKRAKLYAETVEKLKFSLVSETKFKLAGKSKGIMAAMDGMEESLTKMYFNREDLKNIRVRLSDAELVVQLNKERFAAYDFDKNKWQTLETEKPIKAFSLNKDRIVMVAETRRMSKDDARRYKGEKFQGLPLWKKAKLKITTIYAYSADLRKKLAEKYYFAISAGGIYLNEDGSRLAVMSLIENENWLEKAPPPRLYSIGSDWSPVVAHSLENIGFFFDSDLLSFDGNMLLIDRVVPRVHRLKSDGNIDSYRLYDNAYKQLLEISNKVEVKT